MTLAHTRARAAYGRAAETLPPVRQVLMLYDGVMARLHEARRAIEAGRIEERHAAVTKAAAIVDGLHACLDFDRGGAIAPLLDRLYAHVALRLQAINVSNDPRICDEVAGHLGELRAAWAVIAQGGAATGRALPADPATATA